MLLRSAGWVAIVSISGLMPISAFAQEPKTPTEFNNRGNAWADKREFDKAIKDYDEAIRLDPKYADAFNNRGLAWAGKREFDKAIKDYDEAIRLDPKEAIVFYNR